MCQAFEFTGMVNGKPKQEIVMLRSQNNCNLEKLLYQVALEFSLTPKGRKLCAGSSGLSFAQLMDNAAPELFEKHGLTVIRPAENAIQMDQARLILTRYELEAYHGVREHYQRQFNQLRDISSRIARRLFTLWKQGHPVVSTWQPYWLPAKSVEWAYKFLTQCEYSSHMLDQFFEQRVQEMKSGKYVDGPEEFPGIAEDLDICVREP